MQGVRQVQKLRAMEGRRQSKTLEIAGFAYVGGLMMDAKPRVK